MAALLATPAARPAGRRPPPLSVPKTSTSCLNPRPARSAPPARRPRTVGATAAGAAAPGRPACSPSPRPDASAPPRSPPPALPTGLLLAADVQAPPARRGGAPSSSSDAQRRAGGAGPPSSSGGGGRPDGPDPDFFVNVGHAIRTLREDIPALFAREMDWSIYRDDVVFRDPRNCFKGLRNYKIIFWSLRFHGKLFFSALRVDIARIWQPDPREVRVRWTIVGHPRGPFSPSTVGVFDGVSTFKLDSKGLIYEHAVDNVILRPRGGVLQASPLFAGLGLADSGGRVVAVPGGAGGGGGDPGFPCPNFEDAPAGGVTAAATAAAAEGGESGGGGAAALATAALAAAADEPAGPPAPPDPTRLAAARAALRAALAASTSSTEDAMTLVLPKAVQEGRPMAGAA